MVGLSDMTRFNKAFWKWFGDSEVVDEDGDPLRVYHATKRDFISFDMSKVELGAHFAVDPSQVPVSSRERGVRTIPVYLSIQNPLRLTDLGTWIDSAVIPQLEYLEIITTKQALRLEGATHARMRKAIEKAGFDGIVYLNRREGLASEDSDFVSASDWADIVLSQHRVTTDQVISDALFHQRYPQAADAYIAFHPEQIKSVFNRGTWSPDDPDVRRNPTTIKLTPQQADLAGWALDAMADFLPSPDVADEDPEAHALAGFIAHQAATIRKTRKLELPDNEYIITDLLFRLEEQLPDMAEGAIAGEEVSGGLRAASNLSAKIRKATGL